jgi:hypothetical protein
MVPRPLYLNGPRSGLLWFPIHVQVSIIPHVSSPAVSLEGAYASAMHMPITFGTGLLDRLVYHTGSSRSHMMV